MLLLMMMINRLKHQENNHSVTSQGAQLFVGTTPTQKSFRRNLHMPVKTILHQGNNICFQRDGKIAHTAQCAKSRVLMKVVDKIIDIDSFNLQCVILKRLLQSEVLKQHMIIISVDQSISNNDFYKHRCLENIKKYTNRLTNVIINRSTRQSLKPPCYPLLRDLLTTFQCNLAYLCQ